MEDRWLTWMADRYQSLDEDDQKVYMVKAKLGLTEEKYINFCNQLGLDPES